MQIEVHMLHKYPEDFHGFELRVMVTGFIRPEIKFASIGALIDRIHRDISIAKVQLEHKWSMSWKGDKLFS
jgi:riboflavin kinase